MTVSEAAIFDNDIFRRAVHAAAVFIFSRFDGDAVIVDVNIDLADCHPVGRVNVDAVGTGDVMFGADDEVA